jgi:hypothetical protein
MRKSWCSSKTPLPQGLLVFGDFSHERSLAYLTSFSLVHLELLVRFEILGTFLVSPWLWGPGFEFWVHLLSIIGSLKRKVSSIHPDQEHLKINTLREDD